MTNISFHVLEIDEGSAPIAGPRTKEGAPPCMIVDMEEKREYMHTLSALNTLKAELLEAEGHTCIWLTSSYPSQLMWCGKDKCTEEPG